MNRFLNKWKWVLIPAIVVLLIAAVLFTPDGPDKGVSVTFLAFTNHPWNGRMALFVITNQRNHSITYWAGPDSFQLKSNGVWYSPEPNFGKRYVGDTGTWFGTLEPRGWTNVTVCGVPERASTWWAAVHSRRTYGKMDQLRFHLTSNWNAIRNGKPLPGFKGRFDADQYDPAGVQTNYSREMTAESGAPAPSSSPESAEPPIQS
jgi:hypothetical protein